jgi:hypothetical protein
MPRTHIEIVQIDVDGSLVDAKECTKCREVKPLTEYQYRKNGLGRKQSNCKKCRSDHAKKWRSDNLERIKKVGRKYYANNRQEILEHHQERYRKNKEQIREQNKRWRRENPEKAKEVADNWRKANMDKARAYARKTSVKYRKKILRRAAEYRRENREKINARQRELRKEKFAKYNGYKHKRRSRERELISTLNTEQWEQCQQHFNHKCAYCEKKQKLTQDHFVPVSKGGEYTRVNIVPCCRPCNASKGNRNFFEWYPQQPFYSQKRERKILRYLDYKKDKTQQIAMF